MSRITPRALTLVSCTILSFGLAAGPAGAATSKAEKKQNAAIKKSASAAKTAAASAKRVGTAVKKADDKAGAAGKAAGTAIAEAKKANDGVGSINANVIPVALKALTDLRDGLLALKDGLTTAGAGLQKLAAFTAADEYGVVQIASGANSAPIPGCFYETGNIPDNVQDAMVTGTCIVPSGVAGGDALHVLAAVRSNESDGVAGPPAVAAGVAGIVALKVTSTNLGGGGAESTTHFGGTNPNAALGGAPAVAIPLKSAPTSTTETGFPFGPISTDNFVDLIATSYAGGPGAPTFGPLGAGIQRFLEFTVRFNDLTADAADPTA